MQKSRSAPVFLCILAAAVGPSRALAVQISAVGVLESTSARYSRCSAMSEDGKWVVGNSLKSGLSWPFYWSTSTGLQQLPNPWNANISVGGCGTLSNGSVIACASLSAGGDGRVYANGTWEAVPRPGGDTGTRSVFGMGRDTAGANRFWVVGSTYPAENQKGYRYNWGVGSFVDFWGYYQDVRSVAHNGWGVGNNNWSNSYPQPRYRYEHPIFIFNWNENCGAGGNCGWDQIPPFPNFSLEDLHKGRANAINPGGTWVVGYLTYDPTLDPGVSALYHAFKWRAPTNPVPVPVPEDIWPRPTDLGTLGPGDTQSFAYCVSDSTTNPVIGGTSHGTFKYGGYKAVYWDNAGCHDLYAVLQSNGVDLSRWGALNRITGISADGTILCGYGTYDDDNNPGTPMIDMGFVADVITVLQIMQQPAPQSACSGGTAIFTVAAAGAGTLSYRWQKNQVDLTNTGHYSNVTTSALTISNADSTDLANYRCRVSNGVANVTSTEAALTVIFGVPSSPVDGIPAATPNTTDRITWAWNDATCASGYRVKDTAGVLKSGNLPAGTVQWQETGLTPNTQYTRRIYAFNATGESTGSAGQTAWTLSVPPTAGSIVPNVPSVCANTFINWTATAGFGPGTVQYYRYAWDASPTHTWTGTETQWSGGTITTQPTSREVWYLHVQGYNAADVPNGHYDYALDAGVFVKPDLNADCHVDQTDLQLFVACVTGGNSLYDPDDPPTGCTLTADPDHRLAADFDRDGDVDQGDFGVLQKCIGGPTAPPDPACAD